MSESHAEARRIAEEIRDERGPNRIMSNQRAKMWDRNPNEWTRYERILSEALLTEQDALREALERIASLRDQTQQRVWVAVDIADRALEKAAPGVRGSSATAEVPGVGNEPASGAALPTPKQQEDERKR